MSKIETNSQACVDYGMSYMVDIHTKDCCHVRIGLSYLTQDASRCELTYLTISTVDGQMVAITTILEVSAFSCKVNTKTKVSHKLTPEEADAMMVALWRGLEEVR